MSKSLKTVCCLSLFDHPSEQESCLDSFTGRASPRTERKTFLPSVIQTHGLLFPMSLFRKPGRPRFSFGPGHQGWGPTPEKGMGNGREEGQGQRHRGTGEQGGEVVSSPPSGASNWSPLSSRLFEPTQRFCLANKNNEKNRSTLRYLWSSKAIPNL